jgi:hypothetical protein
MSSRSEREARTRALRAVSRMRRDGVSLTEAAKREGTTSNTVMRHAASAVERKGRRITAKPSDRLARTMPVLGPQGIATVNVRGSRQASVLSSHWNATRRYIHTGDDSELSGFHGLSVAGVELETDPDVIEALAEIGVLAFEDIYELTS